MEIFSLIWDDANIEHIARHNVSPKEVEDICFGAHFYRKEGSTRYILSGQSDNGRYLNVVIKSISKGSFRPITAFEMSISYKRRFKRRLGK